jgi:hypothetical protein
MEAGGKVSARIFSCFGCKLAISLSPDSMVVHLVAELL